MIQSPLLNFFVRRVLAEPVAELLQFQTVRCRFAVLGLRIVPLFAITTLQRNNLSGHFKPLLAFSSWLLASKTFSSLGFHFRPPKELYILTSIGFTDG